MNNDHAGSLALIGRGLIPSILLLGCAALAPLREPPPEPPGSATTRDELVRQFGKPSEVLTWSGGRVLVYRRAIGLSQDPNRLSRADPVEARTLVYVDTGGRIVRTERSLR
jgi:hypothetical protein